MRIIAMAALFALAGCQNDETVWITKQFERCAAMGGTGYYDKVAYHCFRHAIGRNTRHLFTEIR